MHGAIHRRHFAIGGERRLANQIDSQLVVRIGVFRVELDGLPERLSGGFGLSRVDHHGAHVVVVLPGLGRVEFRRLLQFRLHLGELLCLAEGQGEVVVGGSIRRIQFQRLVIAVNALGHFGVELRAGLRGRRVDVRVGELCPHGHLFGIQFAGLGQVGGGGLKMLGALGGVCRGRPGLHLRQAGREGVVQFLVFLH